MSQISSLNRVLTMLNRLNNNKRINLTDLSFEFEVSERTIRRDLDLIKNNFDDFLIQDGQFYSAVNKNILNETLQGTDLATFISLINVFTASGSKFKLSPELEKLYAKNKSIYKFSTKPFEELKNKEALNIIEKSINFKQILELNYENAKGKILKIEAKPYKIVFLNENFYLACSVENKYEFMLLRIGMIRKVEIQKNTFYINPNLERFINNIQTPFAKYSQTNKNVEVFIKVPKQISRYFIMKKYLPSQEIIEESESGWLTIKYTVSNLEEIYDLIEKWLPRVQILSPMEELTELMEKKLKQKLESLNKNKDNRANYLEKQL